MGPHFLWLWRAMSHQSSSVPAGDPPWAGWTADVATGTHFREIFAAPLALNRIQKVIIALIPHFKGNCKIFWFAEHKQSHQNVKCVAYSKLAAFFLQGTHWNGENSHHTLIRALVPYQIFWWTTSRTATRQSTQMLSEVVLISSSM